MKLKPHQPTVIIVVITILVAIIRFAFLDRVPPTLNWDEISHGYNAYSILKTGADEWGNRLPAIFRAFGDYKLPIYIYLTSLSVFLFGLTPFAVRFVSVLAGVVAIPLIYLLVNELFGQQGGAKPRVFGVGHLAAILLALTPWHFFIGRPALEANLALTLIIAGTLFLLRGLKDSRLWIVSATFFGLTLHTYNTARVFVPLLLIAFYLIYRKKIKHGKYTLVSLVIIALSLGLVLYQVLMGSGTARYAKLAILSPGAVYTIGQDRLNSRFPPALARLVHNRPVYFTGVFLRNYLSYFSSTFFNQSKGAQTQFAIENQDLFTFPTLFLALIGLVLTLKNRKDISGKFIIVWLILSPVAAATTIDPPQALRPNPMIPAVIILAAYALFEIFKVRRVVAYIFLGSIAIAFISYLSVYFTDYRKTYSQSWQYGYQEAIEYINDHKSEYSRVIMTKKMGEPHIFYAFYSHLDPKKLQPGPDTTRYKLSDWFWTDRLDNVYFVNDWDIPTTHTERIRLESGGTVSTEKALIITSPDHVPVNTTKIETINYLDGSPVFVIAHF